MKGYASTTVNGILDAVGIAKGTLYHHLTPVIAQVVRQGIAEGDFDVDHPEEAVSILLTAAFFLTDEGFESYTPDLDRLMPALLIAAERLFGAEQGPTTWPAG